MPSSPASTLFPYTTLFRSPPVLSFCRMSPRPPRCRKPRWRVTSWPPWTKCLTGTTPGSLCTPPPGRCWSITLAIAFRRGSSARDRKSTRLNSSHANISYAVFPCIYTLSLHDALPISACFIFLPNVASSAEVQKAEMAGYLLAPVDKVPDGYNAGFSLYTAAWPLLEHYPGHRFQTGLFGTRSEEHTSELQSRQYLVCRLPLHLHSFPTRRSSDLRLFYLFAECRLVRRGAESRDGGLPLGPRGQSA